MELGQQVGLRPNDPTLPIELLSGGNQQKVVVGRWLHLRQQGLRLRGSDGRRRRRRQGGDLPALRRRAATAGAAILIVSTDFEEVAKVCHRALVFDRGRVVAELGAADLSVENLLAAASASVGQSAKRGIARSGGGAHAVH